ncbi:MAG: PRC-barrel domain containing protein [bacterium]
MLKGLGERIGHTVQATDGEVGKARDFYFDDCQWIVRYLVVDTGPWLLGRKVLIAPEALADPPWPGDSLPVQLSRREVEQSPPVSADLPVSRQHEAQLVEHFGWAAYWGPIGSGSPGPIVAPVRRAAEQEEAPASKHDPALRSLNEVTGYGVEAPDGEVGDVEHLIADTASWQVRYLVVDTRGWLRGRKVVLAPGWMKRVDWHERRFYVDLGRQAIRGSPEYDPSQPLRRSYEARLHDHYGRPPYW